MDKIEDWSDRAARRMYEADGLATTDVDVFKPYEGYAPKVHGEMRHAHQGFLKRFEVRLWPSAKAP